MPRLYDAQGNRCDAFPTKDGRYQVLLYETGPNWARSKGIQVGPVFEKRADAVRYAVLYVRRSLELARMSQEGQVICS